jgi:hypothetical protein
MEQLRSLSEAHRRQIAEQVFAHIRPYLGSDDVDDLRELRRRAQDHRARLIYEGARDFSDLRFAGASLTEQWAVANIELICSRSPISQIFAERRCKAVEDFVRDNLPDEPRISDQR